MKMCYARLWYLYLSLLRYDYNEKCVMRHNFESENININREFLLLFKTEIKRGFKYEAQRKILLIKNRQGRIFEFNLSIKSNE